MRSKPPTRSGDFRVWLLEGGASPVAVPDYQDCAAISTDPSWGQGDLTREECPNPDAYDDFVVYDEVPGAVDNAKFGIKKRYARALAKLLELTRKRCTVDVQLLIGRCKSPSDYAGGWDKILVAPGGRITNWAGEGFGAMQRADNKSSNEMVDISAREFYELVHLQFETLAAALVVREIVGVDVCAGVSADECDLPCPDKCKVAVAVQLGLDDEVPALPSVVFTSDGGETWSVEDISTMVATDIPTDIKCINGYVVVTDSSGNSYHYCTLASLIAGAPVWAEVTTGFVATHEPNRMVKVGGMIYIAANLGYVYKLRGVGSPVAVIEAGDATTEDLVAIHAIDRQNIVAVGDNNALVASDDGANFIAITGPSAGDNLTAIRMRDSRIWLVGNDDGELWASMDGGAIWEQKALPIVLTILTDIVDDGVEVFASGVSGGAGVILRNTAGGTDEESAWYVLPEDPGSIGTNQEVNRLAVCPGHHNLVYGGGLGETTDGFLTRAIA